MGTLWRFLWFLLPILSLGIAAVYAPVKVYDDAGLPRVRKVTAERDALEQQNRRLRWEVRRLRHRIHAIASDPDYVERIAHNELGLIRPDEVIFQF